MAPPLASPPPEVGVAGFALPEPEPAAARDGTTVGAVTLFRGLVCLQIVGMHAFAAALAPVLSAGLGPAVTFAVLTFRFGYETFFVLAGYFLAQSFAPGRWQVLSVPSFFRRRMVRIAVPFWAAVALGVGGFWVSTVLRGGAPHPGTSGLLPLVFFVHDLFPGGLPSAAYWFMAPLVQSYLLWGAGFWLVRRRYLWRGEPRHHNATLAVMMPATGLALFASLGCVAADWHPRWRITDNALFLALGCFAYWKSVGLPVGRWYAAGVAGVLGVGLATGNPRLVAAAVSATLLPHLNRIRELPDWVGVRLLGAVGVWSYSIYLTHTYVVYRVMNLPAALDWSPTLAGAVGLWAAAILGSVLLGAVFYALVERPLASRARRVRYRTPAGPGR